MYKKRPILKKGVRTKKGVGLIKSDKQKLRDKIDNVNKNRRTRIAQSTTKRIISRRRSTTS